MFKKINISIIIILIIISLSCSGKVRWAMPPSQDKLNKDIIIESDKLFLEEEKLEVRYVICHDNSIKASNDLIFFFHGIEKTEFDWAEKNNFGEIFYDVIKQNSITQAPMVVSISLGAAYFFLEDAPSPYNTNLETVFIKKIIPYFQNKLNKNGRIFLIGHSMGGYNALSLSLRNPELFQKAVVISPFVAPHSPFSKEFDLKGKEYNLPKLQVFILKKTLKKAFKTEDKWNQYNPFYLIKYYNKKNYPLFFISRAQNDLPGFNESINDFVSLLNRKYIKNYNCLSEGDHQTTCRNIFIEFLENIN